jgi:hypothetical protein
MESQGALWENNNMFDELNPNLKRFTIFYTDGALYEDDLTPREPRRLDVIYSAILARAGFLVYDPLDMPTGKYWECTSSDNSSLFLRH